MVEHLIQLFQNILSFLFLQDGFLSLAWGPEDAFGLMVVKRIFIFLPLFAIVVGIWMSSFCLVSTVVRQRRHEFLTSLIITWWDLGKSIFAFWGGIIRFVFALTAGIFGLMKFMVVGLWAIIQDFFLIPFRMMSNLVGSALRPGVPWIAVSLMLIWCLLESVIFTYVMSPLVIDTFSNLTGEQLAENFIRVPLFFFMMFIILGSYAVLSKLADSVRTKNVGLIVKIAAIEVVALFVEVVFLYREFVESLVPWFAQHASDDFSLGIFGTLAISTVAWLGIRGLSWFLFASAGTPTIMAVINRDGIQSQGVHPKAQTKGFELSSTFSQTIRNEMQWLQEKGDDVLGAFMLPPLQILAACVNFCTLFLSSKHLFALPFRSMKEILDSKDLLKAMHDLKVHQEMRNMKTIAHDISGLHKVPNSIK